MLNIFYRTGELFYDSGMKLYIARHGRTNYNDLHICNADPAVDVHLTPQGVAQAQALARRLQDVQFDHIYASRLKRTQQTADIVNAFHHLDIEIDARLDDHRSGFEGKPFAELSHALDTADNRWTACFNDGESIADIKTRVEDFMHDLQSQNYTTVLIVTSQWVMRMFPVVVQGISYEQAWQIEGEQGSYIELAV